MNVSELMTRDVACCSADDSLRSAAQMMWDRDCGAIPVVEPGTRRAVGMITDRDICMAALIQDRPLSSIRISDVMSGALHACHPDDSVADAERTMRERQIRRIPVVQDDGELVGILSLADVVRVAQRAGNGRNREVAPQEVVSTLDGICAPRQNSYPEQRS
jgi:CBS domain-containing protein